MNLLQQAILFVISLLPVTFIIILISSLFNQGSMFSKHKPRAISNLEYDPSVGRLFEERRTKDLQLLPCIKGFLDLAFVPGMQSSPK
jgi:hypothetical protein